MEEKELYISHYRILTRIVADYEVRLERAKREQAEFEEQLKKYNVTTKEKKKIYDELYAEMKEFLERDSEYIERKFQEGKPFKYGDMWVSPSAHDTENR